MNVFIRAVIAFLGMGLGLVAPFVLSGATIWQPTSFPQEMVVWSISAAGISIFCLCLQYEKGKRKFSVRVLCSALLFSLAFLFIGLYGEINFPPLAIFGLVFAGYGCFLVREASVGIPISP